MATLHKGSRAKITSIQILCGLAVLAVVASAWWTLLHSRRDPAEIAGSWSILDGFPTDFLDKAAIEQFATETSTPVQFKEYESSAVAVLRVDGPSSGAFWEEVVIYARRWDYWRKCAEFNCPYGTVTAKTVGHDLVLIDGKQETSVLATIPWNRLGRESE